jgi:hypothetical protein
MSYEDLNKAHVARAAKDKATADKDTSKRSRKRKSTAQDAEEEAVEVVAAGAGSSAPKVKPGKRVGSVQEPAPWKAPVALMY